MTTFDVALELRVAAEVAAVSTRMRRDIPTLRQRRLAALLESARASPLYRPLLEGRDTTRLTLQDLPVATKGALMERFDDWCGDRRVTMSAARAFLADPTNIGRPFLSRYYLWESSGTSGVPGYFVHDAGAMACYDALDAQRRPQLHALRRLYDPLYLTERIAYLGATSGHYASIVSFERLRVLNRAFRDRLRTFSFLAPCEETLRGLTGFEPTILATYPNMALTLAAWQAEGAMTLRLREIWTGGEALTSAMRATIAQTFDCRVVQSYGASEFFTIAGECNEGRLHLNSDWLILESVDHKGRPVPDDAWGETALLTNLANHVQPIIRYDLGDRVRLRAAPCACGSQLPVIEIDGRRDDRLSFPGDRGDVCIAPLALTTVLEESGLHDFELIQATRHRMDLRTPPGGSADAAAIEHACAALQTFIDAQGVRGVRVAIGRRARAASLPSGKRNRVVARACGASRHRAGTERTA